MESLDSDPSLCGGQHNIFSQTPHLLAGLVQDSEVLHQGEQLGLGLLGLLGHVVHQVHAGLVGPDVRQLVQRRDLHTRSIAGVATLNNDE